MVLNPIIKITPIFNSREGTPFCSSLRRMQLYDGMNSVNFFYSEIEHCWLVIYNSGSITINGKQMSDRYFILEEYAQIGIGNIVFNFHNLSESNGLAKIVANSLIKCRNCTMTIDSLAPIIQSFPSEYKDYTFLFEVISSNPVFIHNNLGDFSLNVEMLYNNLLNHNSCYYEEILYEFENTFIQKGRFVTINAKTLSSSPNFQICSKERRQTLKYEWPSLEVLEKFMNLVESCSSAEEYDRIILHSRRYINSYVVPDYSEMPRANQVILSSLESDSRSTDTAKESESDQIIQHVKSGRNLYNIANNYIDAEGLDYNTWGKKVTKNTPKDHRDYTLAFNKNFNYTGVFDNNSTYKNQTDVIKDNRSLNNKYNSDFSYASESSYDNDYTSNSGEEDTASSSYTLATRESNSINNKRKDSVISEFSSIINKDPSNIYHGISKRTIPSSNIRNSYSSVTKLELKNTDSICHCASTIGKRREVQEEFKKCKCKFHYEFPTVVEEINFNSDSETSMASFRSERMGLRPKHPQNRPRRLSFVENQLIERRKYYENYFPFSTYEKN